MKIELSKSYDEWLVSNGLKIIEYKATEAPKKFKRKIAGFYIKAKKISKVAGRKLSKEREDVDVFSRNYRKL